MLITMLADRFEAGGVLRARGTQVDVPNELALRWIGDGVAAPVGNARETGQGIRRDIPIAQDQISGQQYTGNSLVPGAGNAVRTYTMSGSSISAYCHNPLYPTVTFADVAPGVVRMSGTKIAKICRTGTLIRVQGEAVVQRNQFQARVLAHDTSATMGWVEYATTGPCSPVVSTLELTVLNEVEQHPDNSRGYGSWALKELGRAWRCLGNFGIGGGDSEQALALFDSTHGVLRPSFVVHEISTNDIFARGWAAARSIAATLAMVNKIKGIGAQPVIFLIAPRTTGVTTTGGATGGGTLKECIEVNAWAKSSLPALGCIVIDPALTVSNGVTFASSGSSTFAQSANMLLDNVHDDRAGARAKGRALAALIKPLMPLSSAQIITSPAEAAAAKSLFKNVALTAAPGSAPPAGFTGSNVPEGVSVTRAGGGAGAISLPARTVAVDGDAFGNNLVIAATGAANNDQVTITFAIAGAQAAEAVISAALRLSVTGQSNVRMVSAGAAIRYIAEDGLYYTKDVSLLNYAGPGVLNDDLTGPINFPALRNFAANESPPPTFDRVQIVVDVLFGGAGAANISMAHPSMLIS
ncbi:hypothetical protein LNV47_22690 [Paucibacter sp. DJ4R-1]|nr:hypothetical protein [Paucibacter sp. DJ4R-1]